MATRLLEIIKVNSPLLLIINKYWLLAVLLVFCTSAKSEILKRDIYPDDMLILKFTMGQKILLAENIIAYPNLLTGEGDAVQSSVVLSFQEFITAIEFPIVVDAIQGTANGWFIAQQRGFELDLTQAKAIIAGQTQVLEQQYIHWYEDEIYIDIALLSKWFGLSFSYDPLRQTLVMSANEILPFQQKWARENQRNKINQWLANKAANTNMYQNLPLFTTPFDFVSKPEFTLSTNGGFKYDQDRSEGFYQYSGFVNHDFIFQNARWFFKGDEKDNLKELRLSLGRESELNDLAGMGLSQYRIGDSYSYAVPLVSNSVLGTGISLNSFDLGFRTQDDAVTVRGEGTPGWDIELYRNNALFNAGKVADNGTYEFIDVPLTSGINEIKLIFYGPRGEKQQKLETYYMHPDLARAGDFSWRASLHQQQSLFGASALKQNAAYGNARLVLQSEYGFSDNLTLAASWVDIPAKGLAFGQQFISLGSRFTLGSSYFSQQYVQNLATNTHAMQLFASTDFNEFSLNGKYQQFSNGFSSENHKLQDQQLKSNLQLNSYKSFDSKRFNHLSVGVKAQFEEFYQAKTRNNLVLASALATDSFSISNELQYDNDIFTGASVFNLPYFYDWKMRGRAQYTIKPKAQIESLAFTGDFKLPYDFHLSAELNQVLAPQNSTRLGLRLVRQFEGYNFDLSAQYQTGGYYNLAFSFSVDFDGFGVQNNNQTTTGKVNARVFLDNNANQIFDKGDTPLPDVHFSVDGRATEVVTDKSGVILLNTNANRRSVVKISPGVYGDYYWDVSMPERAVLTRVGKPLTVNFAARLNGEVEGMVFKNNENGAPLSGVEIQLLDQDGKVIKTVKSGFDGFYLFEKVPFGQYQIRISEKQLIRLGYVVNQSQSIEVSKDNDIVSGVDFYLKKEV